MSRSKKLSSSGFNRELVANFAWLSYKDVEWGNSDSDSDKNYAIIDE